jgi:hypothetical protein
MMGGHQMGPMAAQMAEMVGPGLMAACHADLEPLGLPAEVRKSIEDKRFELRKKMIPAVAALKVLKMELSRLVAEKGFDLTAAQEKVSEISSKQSEIRAAHIKLLHDLGAVLSDEQWQTLHERAGAPCPECMKRRGGGGHGMKQHRHRCGDHKGMHGKMPCGTRGAMPCGAQGQMPCQTQGQMPCAPSGSGAGMMPGMGGMMHRQGHGHGADTSKEAEEFFKGE